MAGSRGADAQLRYLNERSAKEALRRSGVRVPRSILIDTPEDAPRASALIGPAVALKVVRDDLPHKREAGAMAGPLSDDHGIVDAARSLLARHPDSSGLLVEEWIRAKYEICLALKLHSGLGPILVWSDADPVTGEMLRLSYFPLPTDGLGAALVTQEICAANPMANGRQVESLTEMLLNLASFGSAWALAGYLEIELHPIIVSELDQAVAADALFVIEDIFCIRSNRRPYDQGA